LYGARIPDYHKYDKIISATDYIKIDKFDRERQIPQDPELSFYLKEYYHSKFKIKKLISNYFNDPASRNYGVLIEWSNPF